ncbi:unnamed protein product [Prorocentrum cordatum]|uniref:Uncharacterized protein n=1 Tax=Prorocentrum cordatum TaxID=2364126 RepID=A0ABN9YH11_9DINO|nr:unnamed protein product [Polarella glacialis]
MQAVQSSRPSQRLHWTSASAASRSRSARAPQSGSARPRALQRERERDSQERSGVLGRCYSRASSDPRAAIGAERQERFEITWRSSSTTCGYGQDRAVHETPLAPSVIAVAAELAEKRARA